MKHTDNKQSGNALWFILLAIVLLGGLTVLLSRTGSQTEETGDVERASIYASEIMKYSAGIAGAVQQLLSRGCSENQISFNDPKHTVSYVNPKPAPNNACDIFNVKGGGMELMPKKEAWRLNASGYIYPHLYGVQCIYGVGSGTTTCTRGEVDLVLQVGSIKKEICLAINSRLGIPMVGNEPPSDVLLGTPFIGEFVDTTNSNDDIIGDMGTASAAGLRGKKAFCMRNTTTGGYAFMQVVIAR